MEQPNLRPLTVSEILDKAFRLYRAKFFPLLGIVALMLIPQGILRLIATYYLNDARIVDNLLNIIFPNFALLALFVAISSANLQQEFTIRSVYSESVKRFWRLVGAGFLMGIALILPAVIAGLCISLVLPLGVVGIIIYLPFAMFIGTRWSLYSSVIVLEKAGAMDSLRRSWDLTAGFFWKVFGTSFFASLLSILLTLLPYYLAGTTLKMMGFPLKTVDLITTAVQQASLIFSMPFTSAVQVLIYYDLRIRKEGFDLMLRANEMQ